MTCVSCPHIAGKQITTFPSNMDGADDGSSDNSTGSRGKAAMMAKQLTTKAAGTAAVRKRSLRYYQPPAAVRDQEGKIKRCKSGTILLASLRWCQKSVGILIPLLAFSCLVRELAENEKKELRFQAAAIKALKEGAEAYLIGMLEDAQLCTIHAKRKTVIPKDIMLARCLRRDKVSGNDLELSAQYYTQTKSPGAYLS